MGQVPQPPNLLDRFRALNARLDDLRRAILRAAPRSDIGGNTLIGDDTTAGQGLARPYVPWTSMTAATAAAPPTTTSGSFTEIGRVHGTKQHPQIQVRVLVLTDASTTGEVRLTQDGAAIAGPTTIDALSSVTAYLTLTGPVAGAHMDPLTVLVEARRTAGAGTVGVAIAHAEGRES